MTGCGLVIDAEVWQSEAPSSELSEVVATSASSPAASIEDGSVQPDATETAVPQPDSGVVIPPPQAWRWNQVLSCTQPVDTASALFDFEDASVTDSVEVLAFPDATQSYTLETYGTANLTVGASSSGLPSACGNSLGFEDDAREYFRVPPDPRWRRKTGSVDFWFKYAAFPGSATQRGLVSRDASGRSEGGHLRIRSLTGQSGQSQWTLRVQSALDAGGDCDFGSEGAGCEAMAEDMTVPGVWYHALVNYGPPAYEFYIDGQLILSVELESQGIDENDEPWYFGGDPSAMRADSTYDDLVRSRRYAGFHIAHLRFGDVRRSFL